MLSVDISDITIITVKNLCYCCIIHGISKSEAIKLLKILFLKIVGYLEFSVFSRHFFYFLYKMVHVMGVYKSLNISIRTVMKNPETTEFVPDHLTTKKCVIMQLKITLSIKICS